MPIMHIVLFKLKEGISADAITAMNEAVKSMVRSQAFRDGWLLTLMIAVV